MQVGASRAVSSPPPVEGGMRLYNAGWGGGPSLQERLCAIGPVIALLSRQLELPMPALSYDECGEINAGVTGTGPHDAVLHFSGGALKKLTGSEAAAVAAHELAHIAAGDFDGRSPGRFVSARWGALSLGWLSNLVRLVWWARWKRSREYAADSLAAELVGEEALIAALRKTARDTRHVGRGWLATHPHPRRRIRALRKLQRERSRNRANARNKLLARAFYQGV
jgi:Zn-dependent protease with chaperone function